jgi:hypothetical protein
MSKPYCSGDVWSCFCLSCRRQRSRIDGKNNQIQKAMNDGRFANPLRGTAFEIDNSRISFAIIDGRIIRI